MSGINDIVVLGYGSWSSVNKLPTLGYVSRTPQLHNHIIEGPSNYLCVLEGPSTYTHPIEGPSQQVLTIEGSD